MCKNNPILSLSQSVCSPLIEKKKKRCFNELPEQRTLGAFTWNWSVISCSRPRGIDFTGKRNQPFFLLLLFCVWRARLYNVCFLVLDVLMQNLKTQSDCVNRTEACLSRTGVVGFFFYFFLCTFTELRVALLGRKDSTVFCGVRITNRKNKKKLIRIHLNFWTLNNRSRCTNPPPRPPESGREPRPGLVHVVPLPDIHNCEIIWEGDKRKTWRFLEKL